jgi:transcriptional regulator with GAF, ATPase, and Fis domain
MSRNSLNSVLGRDSDADAETFEDVPDEGQDGDGVEQNVIGRNGSPVHAANGSTKDNTMAVLAVPTPQELAALRTELQSKFGFHDILSKSPLMYSVFRLLNDMAHATSTVLIEGQTGTGKEQIARAIHRAATQRAGAFVAINCAALPEALLESELFGHEKGAFTSAAGQRRGRFEMAQGGVIFLDEVGDMPANMQAKLLRVLQERAFERLGGTETIKVDVHVIGATNRSLKSLVNEGKFREDLFYRLNVVRINLPPLCDRPEDIPLLAAHFIAKHARPAETAKRITARALNVLLNYSWPGNIRELENAIERASVTSRDLFIDVKDLPTEITMPAAPLIPNSIDLKKPLGELVRQVVAQMETQYIRKALIKTHGHIGKCARICGLSRRCITSKIAKYNLNLSEMNGE